MASFAIPAAECLDDLAQARTAHDGLAQVDAWRRRVAPGSIFSIQQNVTTAADPANEIRLRRFYSSEARQYPVDGTKRKTRTAWTECLFLRGQVFVGEGAHVLAQHFDDYPRMREWGLCSVVNVPLLRDNACFATFNVFGVHPAWDGGQVLALRLLALAAARWVPAAPGLSYAFTDAPANDSMEA